MATTAAATIEGKEQEEQIEAVIGNEEGLGAAPPSTVDDPSSGSGKRKKKTKRRQKKKGEHASNSSMQTTAETVTNYRQKQSFQYYPKRLPLLVCHGSLLESPTPPPRMQDSGTDLQEE